MYEPRQWTQILRAQNSEFGFIEGLDGHKSIIKDARYPSDLGEIANRNILFARDYMASSENTFCWTKDYSVNIAVLDEQHKDLFNTVNELEQALSAGSGDAALDSILHKLVQYALSHFAAEEHLMREHAFPGLMAHVVQHQMFRARVAEFLTDHRAGKAGVLASLLLFMQDWLKKHVLKIDKQYSPFLTARGVR